MILRNHRVYDAIPHTMPEESKEQWEWPEDSKAYMGKLCHYVAWPSTGAQEVGPWVKRWVKPGTNANMVIQIFI